jgi:hypothetical protein
MLETLKVYAIFFFKWRQEFVVYGHTVNEHIYSDVLSINEMTNSNNGTLENGFVTTKMLLLMFLYFRRNFRSETP